MRGFGKIDQTFANSPVKVRQSVGNARGNLGDKPLIHVASLAGDLYQGHVKGSPGENTEWLAITEQ